MTSPETTSQPTRDPLLPVRSVALGVVALDEEAYLPSLLDDIISQDFDHGSMEVILVDGGSSDSTKEIMREFAAKQSGFSRVCVFDNPKKTQPAGWNMVLREMTSDAVIRVDAHASIAPDFVSQSVRVLNAGESICGGHRATEVPQALKTPWRETLHAAEEAAFGSSAASYRREGEARYVDSVFHGAYRREAIERIGLFNEVLLRTEDNDYHYRARKAGYRIRFDPAISSVQFMRSSLPKMLKQKYGNGYWIGRTLFVQPGCISPFHLIPLVFALGVIALALAGALTSWAPFAICGAIYATLCAALSIRTAVQSGKANPTMLALPLVFFGIHLSYGLGSLSGALSGLARPLEKEHTKEASDDERT
ncbi:MULTISPECIES: glycosyltransferase family 2 protein [unclassified Adlercreutzia]|uniref:glycosyltransferase family 2 protein n=1 Tax=unclassified Adlercreutzia TaxID=2636013 RepID=UPI0013EA4C28|nr:MULTISPECIES: glycosyltransferase family 2 protein [unclassified Adlercreutzia]